MTNTESTQDETGDPFGVVDTKPVYAAHEHRTSAPRSVWDLPIAGYFWRG